MAGASTNVHVRRTLPPLAIAAVATALLAGWSVAPAFAAGALTSGTQRGGTAADAARLDGVVDLTGTRRGVRLARAAHGRLAPLGFAVAAQDLRVLRDGTGILIVPRTTSLDAVRVSRPDGRKATELVPVARTERAGTGHKVAPAPSSEPPQPSWAVVYTGCYERISDTWSWIDHCAQILRLLGDGDSTKDSYVLERWATAGANWPWVLKSAAISAYPTESSASLAWVDWAPRSDRTGPCQPYNLRVVSPYPTPVRSVDRCETWDITKASRGGDYRLDWYGCTCTHDRELAFSSSVSVAQGRLPSWYVPADVHGYPF